MDDLIHQKNFVMDFHISKKVNQPFNETIEKVTSELGKAGFGVISRIDLKDKFKEKLGIEFRQYTILGACNPKLAHEAIAQEDKIGVLLPCNILVQESPSGGVEISAINPLESIGALNNERLAKLATEVSAKLNAVIGQL